MYEPTASNGCGVGSKTALNSQRVEQEKGGRVGKLSPLERKLRHVLKLLVAQSS